MSAPFQSAAQAGDRPKHIFGQGPRRRRLDAAARRESILDAAIPLFASFGYEQTRMSEVAARVGVTEPVIFQNFGTKAELFAAALERVSEQAVTYLTDLANAHANVLDWLRHLLAAEHLDQLHTAPMFGVVFADAHRLQFEPEVSAALDRSLANAVDAMARILQRGQAEHSIRADAPALTLAWFVTSLIQARQFRQSYTPEPSPEFESAFLARILDSFGPHAGLTRARKPSPAGRQRSLPRPLPRIRD